MSICNIYIQRVRTTQANKRNRRARNTLTDCVKDTNEAEKEGKL